MPHVALGATRLHYLQKGQGPDVVLLHAVTSNLAVWVFIGLLDALLTDFRVTAYDLRGHGLSDAPPTGYTSADHAADFRALHEALGLGPAYLVGHSFGAVIATHTAMLHPERVCGLVLSDPYFPGLAHVEPNLGQSAVWQELKELFGRVGVRLSEEVDFTRLFHAAADLTAEQKQQIARESGTGSLRWVEQLPRLAATTCGADLFAVAGLTAQRIASVRQPVAALYDEHTPFAATREYLRTRLPNGTIDTVPGARHVAPLQNSADFVRLVREHLKRMKDGATL
jgi:pimeloyl-ACP methyl ester carboxylesterase